MALKDVLLLDTQKETIVKPYLRIDPGTTDPGAEAVIDLLIKAAQQRADAYLNRDFAQDAPELDDIKLACLIAIANWYDNRGSASQLPQDAKDILDLYRFQAGF